MEQVQFEEQLNSFRVRSTRFSFLTNLVIKLGLAKDQSGANKLMLLITALAILSSVFICTYYVFGYNPFAKRVTPDYSNLPPDVQKILQPTK